MSEEQKEIKELKSRISLIEEFYEENSFIKRIKFYYKYYKEKRRNANYRNNTKNDTSRNNTISDNSNGNTWNYENNNIFNNEKIENLQQENKQLKERIEYLERSNNRREDTILEQRQKISDLEDNWNKLKEYLHNVDVVIDYSENYDGRFINYDELVNKMQEIEKEK